MSKYLLLTTTTAVFLLNLQTRQCALLDQGQGVYYGVTFSNDTVFVACRRAEVGAERESQQNVILCLDRGMRVHDSITCSPALRDVHQLLFHDDTLLACSTFDDAIMRFSTIGRRWDVWHPFGVSAERDRHHINSIGCDDDGLLLAGNKPTGWFARFTRHGAPVPATHQRLGIGTHNVWREDGDIFVCSSDEGAIRSATGRFVPVVQRGWVRGFASDSLYRYVGVSQNLVRGVRERSDSMVVQLDRAGRRVNTYAFTGFGMVHDLRLLGVADPSHNGVAFQVDADDALLSRADYVAPDTPISLAPSVP